MLKVYKPTKTNKGSMVSFFLTNDNSIMVQLVKQASWENGQGTFFQNYKNDNAKIVAKLGRDEVAGILDSMDRNVEFSFTHSHGKSPYKLSGFFQPGFRSQKNEETGKWEKVGDQIGYSLSITRVKKEDDSKLTIRIGFKYNEARLLGNDLVMMLERTFVENAFDGKKQDEGAAGGSEPKKEAKPKKAVAVGAEEEADEDELW